MFVVFAAPLLSENAMRMVEAAATLPGVRLGVITHDSADALRHLHESVAHWKVADILNVDQLVWATRELAFRKGTGGAALRRVRATAGPAGPGARSVRPAGVVGARRRSTSATRRG